MSSKQLSRMYVHALFHVKNNDCKILPEDEMRLYAYINGIIILNDSSPIIVNGIDNHIHVLCILSRNISIATLLEEILNHSSHWIKSLNIHYHEFAWHSDYCCYSVSKSRVKNVQKFIENQKELHKDQSFEEEYRKFLNVNEGSYKEEYSWT